MRQSTDRYLNLASGQDRKRGYINADILDLPGVDVVTNLNQFPWPFKKNEFNHIFCDNGLEHLDDLVKTMEEIHRISRNHALVEIIVPYYSSHNSFKDPTHRHFFSMETFDYFTDSFAYNFYTKARFRIKSRRLLFPKKLLLLEIICNKWWTIYQQFFSFILPASGLRFVLETVK